MSNFDEKVVDRIKRLEREVERLRVKESPGAWVAYTPIWTAYTGTPSLGNGTITGKYTKVGKMVTAVVTLTFGSTTSVSGTSVWYISLPFIAVTGMGVWVAFESGVKYYTGTVKVYTGSATIGAFYQDAGQGYLSETSPHTWGENDTLEVMVTYEAK